MRSAERWEFVFSQKALSGRRSSTITNAKRSKVKMMPGIRKQIRCENSVLHHLRHAAAGIVVA